MRVHGRTTGVRHDNLAPLIERAITAVPDPAKRRPHRRDRARALETALYRAMTGVGVLFLLLAYALPWWAL